MGDMISSLLFQPPTPTYLHPSRHFWLNTDSGGRIPAFFIERPGASVTILFSHGNAEDLGMIYDWFSDLARVLRCNIMAYDYTGQRGDFKSVSFFSRSKALVFLTKATERARARPMNTLVIQTSRRRTITYCTSESSCRSR